jgi:hypothetical protein
MMRLSFGRKPVLVHPISFYCRMHNRVVGGCPSAQGPGGCPLLRECPADTLRGGDATASAEAGTRH